MRRTKLTILALICATRLSPGIVAAQSADPLPSWNDTAPKKTIRAFFERVTKQGSLDFAPAAERIAVFDNDGTLEETRNQHTGATPIPTGCRLFARQAKLENRRILERSVCGWSKHCAVSGRRGQPP